MAKMTFFVFFQNLLELNTPLTHSAVELAGLLLGSLDGLLTEWLLTDWLNDELVGWLAGWLWLFGWLARSSAVWLAGFLAR